MWRPGARARRRRTSARSSRSAIRAAGTRRLFRVRGPRRGRLAGPAGAPGRDEPDGEKQLTVQDQLEEGTPEATDLAALLLRLESEGRFHRDRGFGRIYHVGGVSVREDQVTDSLHVSVHGNRLTAHVDHVSPVGSDDDWPRGYSLRRTVLHNAKGMTHDLVRLLRGRQGDHRCQLDCEWLPDLSDAEPDERDLLDPRQSTWSVHLEVRVAGTLDERRLQRAFEVALDDRPLPEDLLEVVTCADDASLDEARRRLQAAVVWAHRWPPLRACLAHSGGGDVLLLNLNHAAADAFASLRVLDCVAQAYADGTGPDPALDLLATRELPVRPASPPVPLVVKAYQKAVEKLRNQLARPARLAPDGVGEDDGSGFHLRKLSVEETQRVITVERAGTSRNTLMAALHLAIGEWNLEHGTPGRQIGVLVPVNLRPEEWREETIGNFSVTARVTTSRRHRSGPAAALKAVSSQTTRNKRTRTGVALVAALERSGLLPLWAKQSMVVLQPLTRNRMVDTAMLAQLGRIEDPPTFGPEAGETVELWFSVPARAPLALSVGAVTVGDRLHLTFRYPRRLFSPDAASRFADCYLDQVREVGNSRAGA